jgi:hypothetical protein
MNLRHLRFIPAKAALLALSLCAPPTAYAGAFFDAFADLTLTLTTSRETTRTTWSSKSRPVARRSRPVRPETPRRARSRPTTRKARGSRSAPAGSSG